MFTPTQLAPFIIAALVLIIIPGPAVLYIIARSIEQGKLAGIVSVLGIALGALGHTIAAALGLSAILATSAVAFGIVKYLGAAYLIYLGLITWRHKAPPAGSPPISTQPLNHLFRQGIIVNLLNPKTALFFLAFLPQFADPTQGSVTVQILVLGLIFVLIALLSDGLYALLAGQIGHWLNQNPRLQTGRRYLSGTIYLTLGLVTAFSGGNSQ